MKGGARTNPKTELFGDLHMKTATLGKSQETNRTQTEPMRIVVRYSDGQILKGYTQNFFPNKPGFLVTPISDKQAHEPLEVRIEDLKGLFFVRDFEGHPSYEERKQFLEDDRPIGRKVEVTFKDGEVIVGTTMGYDPLRAGFFLYPADSGSNNLRVFAVNAAVRQVLFL
ncbi:MAG: hypothetical protein P8013_14105 [Candidatus Sulfobium sp.]